MFDTQEMLQDTPQEQITQDQAEGPTEQPAVNEQPTGNAQREESMRILRERAKAAEQRAQELERMMQMNMSQNQPSTKMTIADDDDDSGVSDDAYVEGKQFNKHVKKLKQSAKQQREELEQIKQQYALSLAEVKIKATYSDFDNVVTQENIERLKVVKPSLYRSIMANPDLYDRGATAYDAIKMAGLVDETYPVQDQRIDQNKAKPRSQAVASPQSGETPLARVGDYDRRILTEERKEQLRRQIEEARARY